MYNSLEKKAKGTEKVISTFFKILGKSKSQKLLSFILKQYHKKEAFTFPIDVARIKQILIILPEDPLQTLYQLKNVISLISIFKHSVVTLLCEHSIAPIVGMLPGLNIVEYNGDDRIGFKFKFLNLSVQFQNMVDICFLLDHQPELSIQYFTASTGAPVRIGYENSGCYPFLNLRVRPSSGKKYLQDWNCSISQMFGGFNDNLHWSVAKKTIEEVQHLFKEAGIKKGCNLGGIDGTYLIQTFGKEKTSSIIESIVSIHDISWYVYTSTKTEEVEWFRQQGIPLMNDLSVSRTAALVMLSEIIITGNTLFYGLATLLERPAVGFFSKEELELYCPQSPRLRGISMQSESESEYPKECLRLIKDQLNLFR